MATRMLQQVKQARCRSSHAQCQTKRHASGTQKGTLQDETKTRRKQWARKHIAERKTRTLKVRNTHAAASQTGTLQQVAATMPNLRLYAKQNNKKKHAADLQTGTSLRTRTCRYVLVSPGTFEYVPVRAGTCMPVRAGTCRAGTCRNVPVCPGTSRSVPVRACSRRYVPAVRAATSAYVLVRAGACRMYWYVAVCAGTCLWQNIDIHAYRSEAGQKSIR